MQQKRCNKCEISQNLPKHHEPELLENCSSLSQVKEGALWKHLRNITSCLTSLRGLAIETFVIFQKTKTKSLSQRFKSRFKSKKQMEFLNETSAANY